MNSNLYTTFRHIREAQAAIQGRGVTAFDQKVGDVIHQAASLAMSDVKDSILGGAIKVVSAPTGSGKSTSATAFAVAGIITDPDFSCSFIVETSRQAEEVYRMLLDLLPLDLQGDAVVWSVAHDERTSDDESWKDYGVRPLRRFHPDQMKTARIVVCTHRRWLNEMDRNRDGGVRFYRGHPRSVLFIDEHPALVKMVEMTPGDVVKFRDVVFQKIPGHPWVPILNNIISRMDEAFNSDGAAYAAVELVTREEAKLFTAASAFDLLEFTNGSPDERREKAQGLEDCVRFIVAAADGCVFLSRQYPISFVAYELQFRPSSGYVLLDATADITGMTVLMKGMEEVDVPKVDFSNLSVFHLDTPEAFTGSIRDLTSKALTARPYAEWMKGTVMEHTSPGDRVLVVTHKAILDHDYLARAEDPEAPVDWDGREVNVIHWGMGVGSNKYKDASHVFLFSEFYIPKREIIGNVLAHRGKRAVDADLSGAVSAHLQGDYLTMYQGHLLRWTKQLACRGNVRNIDGDGRCGSMKLFTSMKLDRLITFLDRLFPGCTVPKLVRQNNTSGQGKPQDRLIELLSTSTADVLSSDEVEEMTGVCATALQRALRSPRVKPFLNTYGWTLVSAKDIGLPGKRKCLAKLPLLSAAA